MQEFVTFILASGEGTGMKSSVSKFAHEICGQAMVLYAMEAANGAGSDSFTMVLDQSSDCIKELVPENAILTYNNGTTWDALWQARHTLEGNKNGILLVLPADYPLLMGDTLKAAYNYHIAENNQVTVLTNQTSILTDICFININSVISALAFLKNEKGIGTIITSDIYRTIESMNQNVKAFCISDSQELMRVDDRLSLDEAERIILKRIIRKHMENGVTFHLPDTTIIHAKVQIGKDTVIQPGTILEGNTVIGEGCRIGPNSRIENGTIGNNVSFMNSVMLQSRIGDNTKVGPFAYIRPGSNIGENVKIGDFVEVKNAVIGNKTSVAHLSYIGDADVGKNVNVGCGVVIVNYDGKKKHRTFVGDNAFVGCNVNLVSPVVVKDHAYIAAGSTITDEVPEYALAIARSRQTIIKDWVTKKGLV